MHAVLFAAALVTVAQLGGDARPNMLLIVADDLTFSDLGFTGSVDASTPHLDRLRTRGMELTGVFTPAPTCSPTRHALYTGLDPVRSGAYPNHTRVRDGVGSVFGHLGDAGYRTALCGKQHVGPKASFPYEHLPRTADRDALREFVTREAAQPWLLVFASNQPHTPWNLGPRDSYDPATLTMPEYLHDNALTRERRADYLAEVEFLDGQVGRLLALLDDTGQTDDTLVVFLSEQGSGFPTGGKWSLYDRGIRAATLVRWPGVVEPGSTSDALVSYSDVAPTLLAAAGVDPNAIDTGVADAFGARGFDGASFLPVLKGHSDFHRDMVFAQHTTVGINGYCQPYPMRSARDRRHKYIRNLAPDNEYWIAGIHGNDLYRSWQADAADDPALAATMERLSHRPAEELYDLAADPLERRNLAGVPELAAVQRRLSGALDAWMRQQGDEGMATETAALSRQTRNRRKRKPADKSGPKRTADALAAHDRAVTVKQGWIRDPYVVVGPDGMYYLTGTTALPGDPREQADKYNTGLGPQSIVGWKMRVWRSPDLATWEDLGTPFDLTDGIWPTARPKRFEQVPRERWRLWAPELHFIDGHWVIVHTSPAPVKGANLALTSGPELAGPFTHPLGTTIGRRHDPALFIDDDGTVYLIWGATKIAPLTADLSGFAAEPTDIGPEGRKMGHEGCLIRRIGGKHVLFGTGWSTDRMRRGTYNLYCCTANRVTGPYGPRRFVGRFLGHGTPFVDKDGRWWCTAFFNADQPPLPTARAGDDLGEDAYSINPQGVTLVPLEVSIADDGAVTVRAKDPAYATPGGEEVQDFSAD